MAKNIILRFFNLFPAVSQEKTGLATITACYIVKRFSSVIMFETVNHLNPRKERTTA